MPDIQNSPDYDPVKSQQAAWNKHLSENQWLHDPDPEMGSLMRQERLAFEREWAGSRGTRNLNSDQFEQMYRVYDPRAKAEVDPPDRMPGAHQADAYGPL